MADALDLLGELRIPKIPGIKAIAIDWQLAFRTRSHALYSRVSKEREKKRKGKRLLKVTDELSKDLQLTSVCQLGHQRGKRPRRFLQFVFRVCAMLVSDASQNDISASLTSRISRVRMNLYSKVVNSNAGFVLSRRLHVEKRFYLASRRRASIAFTNKGLPYRLMWGCIAGLMWHTLDLALFTR